MTDWADEIAESLCAGNTCCPPTEENLATALRKARAMTWTPIETAPKDIWVLVWYPDGMEASIAILEDGSWIDWDGDMYGPPTHWQELPGPPTE